jgi:hypothetical protein
MGAYDEVRRNPLLVIAALSVAFAIGIGAGLVSRARAQVTVASPVATSTTVGTSSTAIIGVNPSRRSIQICCGSSATNTCAIAPTGITPVTGATGTGVQLASGACFAPPNNQLYSGSGGGAGAGWNGIGSAASVTIIVLEWL